MGDQAVKVRIVGLTKLDKLELQKMLGSEQVSFEESRSSTGTHGELATATAVVIVSLAALRVLAVYLATSQNRTIGRKRIEVVNKDGSKRVEEIEISDASSSSPDDKVMKQLASVCSVDIRGLTKS